MVPCVSGGSAVHLQNARLAPVRAMVTALAIGGGAVPATPLAPIVPPSVVFEGFGLGDFEGAGSVASALRKSDVVVEDAEHGPVPLDIFVKGPSGRDVAAYPLAAEIRSRIEGLDLTAGVLADQRIVHDGPSKWVGAVGMSSIHESGREMLEVRTALGQDQQATSIALEVGPRVERRLPGGILVFLDGKAEARSLRTPTDGSWSLPGMTTDGSGMVGITARTGLVR